MPSKTVEEQRAALVNASRVERGLDPLSPRAFDRKNATVLDEALCRALEAHDAFARDVSDAVEKHIGRTNKDCSARWAGVTRDALSRFILPKPDPLVEAIHEAWPGAAQHFGDTVVGETAERLRKALASRGLKLVEVGDE